MNITLKCEFCGEEFQRRKAEHTRNQKKNRRVYCGRSCSGHHTFYENIPLEKRNTYDIAKHSNNRLSELSPFRYYMRRIDTRVKEALFKKCDFDIAYLKDVWQNQSGICPYTGWQLVLRQSSNDYSRVQPNYASLDRIDSTKGYIKGNVQFIAYIANVAKNSFTGQQLIDFCKAVTKNTGI